MEWEDVPADERRRIRNAQGQTKAQLNELARRKLLDNYFLNRTFDVVREIHLPKHQAFRTIFNQMGRHGFVLRARDNGELVAVSARTMRDIHDEYLAVNRLPDRRLKVPTYDPSDFVGSL